MLRAVCTKDPERMKVALIESIGDLLTEIGDKSFAQDNYNYARQIRQNNDWSVANSLQRKITEEKEVVSKDIKRNGFKSCIRFLIVNEEKLLSCLTAGVALYKQINHITFNLKIFLANPIYLKPAIV